MYIYVECIHTYIAALVEQYHNGFVCRQLQATEMYKNLLSVQSMVYKFVYLGKFQPNSTHLYIITYAKVFSNMRETETGIIRIMFTMMMMGNRQCQIMYVCIM